MADTTGRRGVKVIAVQEVHYTIGGVQWIGGGTLAQKLFWKGVEKSKGSPGIMVREERTKDNVAVEKINTRIMSADSVVVWKKIYLLSTKWRK